MESTAPFPVKDGEPPTQNRSIQRPKSLYDLTFPELEQFLADGGTRPLHAKALWHALYQALEPDLTPDIDFLPPLRRWLNRSLNTSVRLDLPEIAENLKSTDGYTRKLLLRLEDSQQIETVIMGYPGRFTACVSTQVGCAMGCVFCATGQMGFVRNLHPGEIVAQVVQAQRQLRSQGPFSLRNVVLMGMGEPLANYEAVTRALEIITDTRGTNVGPARVTVSTVGVVPGILRLAEENQPYNLAVSLHATTDEERSALVPINHRWCLDELIAACRTYTAKTGRRIFFGWTLIEGQNDRPEQAHQLVKLIQGLEAHVNLIRLNPTRDFGGQASEPVAAVAFRAIIQAAGFPCTIRQRRGIDVAAGCGQLRSPQTIAKGE